jgi:hypothetical protein
MGLALRGRGTSQLITHATGMLPVVTWLRAAANPTTTRTGESRSQRLLHSILWSFYQLSFLCCQGLIKACSLLVGSLGVVRKNNSTISSLSDDSVDVRRYREGITFFLGPSLTDRD